MIDEPLIDEDGKGIQFFGKCRVLKCTKIEGQADVFLLQAEIPLERKTQVLPKPGQFYMLRSAKSGVTFNRPISVYHSTEVCEDGNRKILADFLILEKGQGTRELCHCLPGEEILLLGPSGNTFETPVTGAAEGAVTADGKKMIAVVGGGIGVAPVANFASSLPKESYDFFASFKSGSYGLDYISPRNLIITTDDGSVGIKGMLPVALSAQKIKNEGYAAIYACGPTPMLAYVQRVASECGVKAYLSLEHRMLCGVGACLGCTIQTKLGSLRVCADGPVFDSEVVQFDAPAPRRQPLATDEEPDLSVELAGVHFKNPVFAASGTFGYGQNFRGVSDVSWWGAICSKGTTLEPREGNDGERSIEVPAGDINSIGLQNPGARLVIENQLPQMLALPTTTIMNLAGSDLESYVEIARLFDKTDVPMLELNISCPNVKAGGQAWGLSCDLAEQCVRAVRAVTKKPLMVKLSPNAPDLRGVAMACVRAGADALSLINTVQATAIDIETGRPFFKNIRAGWCGPAIKPLALRMVYDVVEEMNKLPEGERIPVVGIGGISKWEDAVEFIMAGAHAVEIGSASFVNPDVAKEVCQGLAAFMKRKGYKNLAQMRGIAQVL